MIIVGIDPGISGAMATFRNGKLIGVTDLPMVKVAVGKGFRTQMVPATLGGELALRSPDSTHVYLEQVASRPGEGAVGAFSFGRGFGQIEGILAALQIPYTLVPPGRWKKAIGIGPDKGLARMRASREFPAFAAQFARVKDDGRAEASLIGLYGTMQGKTQ